MRLQETGDAFCRKALLKEWVRGTDIAKQASRLLQAEQTRRTGEKL